jgi:hypothetical protein
VDSATKERVNPSRRAVGSRRAQRYEQHRRRVRHRIIGVASAAILAAAVTVVSVASSGGGDTTETTTPFVGSTLNVILGDYLIAGDLTAPAGNVRLEAVNQGGIIHNVGVRRGPISGDMKPGGAFTVELGSLAPGTYQLYCDIVDHVEQGMVADLVIT